MNRVAVARGNRLIRHASCQVDAASAKGQHPCAVRPGARRREARAVRLGRRTTTVSLSVLAILVGVAAAAYIASTASESATANVAAPSIEAQVAPLTGLYPGATGTVLVTVTNTGQVALVMTTMSAGPAIADGCPGDNYQFGVSSDYPTVAPTGTATLSLPVTMPTTAPNSCQGAEAALPVHISGTAQ